MAQINGTNFLETCQQNMNMYGLGSNICAKMRKIPQLGLLKNINEIK